MVRNDADRRNATQKESDESPDSRFKVTQRNIILRDEQKDLLYACQSIDEIIMLRLGLYSGLRVSEMVNLCPKDLDKTREVIRIRDAKGGKDRFACIDRATMQILIAIAHERSLEPDEPFLKTTTRTLQRWFDSLQDRAWGQKKYSPHDMRHTNITMLLEEGMDLNAVKDHAGHEDIRTTEIYTHFTVKKRVISYQKAVSGGLL